MQSNKWIAAGIDSKTLSVAYFAQKLTHWPRIVTQWALLSGHPIWWPAVASH
jgi:hypothetical protein